MNKLNDFNDSFAFSGENSKGLDATYTMLMVFKFRFNSIRRRKYSKCIQTWG